MAFDISESAIYSWLRHIEKYSIVHNNWKLSPTVLEDYSKDANVNSWVEHLNNRWKEEYDAPLFKNDVSQTLRQGECDAIGLKLETGNFVSVGLI